MSAAPPRCGWCGWAVPLGDHHATPPALRLYECHGWGPMGRNLDGSAAWPVVLQSTRRCPRFTLPEDILSPPARGLLAPDDAADVKGGGA